MRNILASRKTVIGLFFACILSFSLIFLPSFASAKENSSANPPSTQQEIGKEAESVKAEIAQLEDAKKREEQELASFEADFKERQAEYTEKETESRVDADNAEISRREQKLRYYTNRLDAANAHLAVLEESLKEEKPTPEAVTPQAVESPAPSGKKKAKPAAEEAVSAPKGKAKKETTVAAAPKAKVVTAIPPEERKIKRPEKKTVEKKIDKPAPEVNQEDIKIQRERMQAEMKAKMKLVKSEVIKTEPTESQPAPSQLEQPELAKPEDTKAELSESEPVKSKPAKVESKETVYQDTGGQIEETGSRMSAETTVAQAPRKAKEKVVVEAAETPRVREKEQATEVKNEVQAEVPALEKNRESGDSIAEAATEVVPHSEEKRAERSQETRPEQPAQPEQESEPNVEEKSGQEETPKSERGLAFAAAPRGEAPVSQPMEEVKPEEEKPKAETKTEQKIEPKAEKKELAPQAAQAEKQDIGEKLGFKLSDKEKKAREREAKKAEEEREKSEKAEIKSRKKEIREKVKELREEEWSKFKNIDRGFFKERITETYYIRKEDFIAKETKALKDCIDRAMEVHTPALVACERMSLARRKRIKALRDIFPKAEFEFEYRRGSLSGDAWKGDDYHMNFRHPAFRGGELWYTFLQEDANVRVTSAEYNQVVAELYLDVSKAYFEYLRARNVQIAREVTSKQAAESWDITRKKWKEGLIAEIEYLNMESLYEQANHDLEAAKQDTALAMLELQKFLGLEIDEPVDVPTYFSPDEKLTMSNFSQDWMAPGEAEAGSMENVTDKNLEQYIELAYENRPDLKVETERLRSARYGRWAARGGFLPQLDLVLGFGQMGEAYKNRGAIFLQKLYHGGEFHFGLEAKWNVGGSTFKYVYDNDQKAPSVTQFAAGSGTTTRKNTFTASFLDDLQQFVETKEARVTEVEQIVELEQKEREVIRDVKESYFNFYKSYVQLKSVLKRMEYKRKMVELAKHRMGLNEIQVSEYLQAEIELAEENAQLYRAIADFYIAKASFNRAIGVRDYLPMKYYAQAEEKTAVSTPLKPIGRGE
ncbi:MAG: TolC family protein [Candidatus Omnitrophica bacterium]|nr:TolC family protein [Candidatus Omnitrophota bacterium]